MKPDDDYLLKLGFAHYRFQYVEWAVIYAPSCNPGRCRCPGGEDAPAAQQQAERRLGRRPCIGAVGGALRRTSHQQGASGSFPSSDL